MTAKLNPFAVAPTLMQDWQKMSMTVAADLEPSLKALVEIRASQINGCANCLNLHTSEARENGETNQRLDLIAAWREAPCYTDRERAALAWTEIMTRLCEGHEQTHAYEVLEAEFTDQEKVSLTLMINVINGWNRLAVGFGLWADPAAVRAAAKVAAA